jgi:CRISPR-associated Csx10 family RAMP protein
MLSRGTLFQVGLRGPAETLAKLRELVKESSEAGVLRVGNNRTRGLGGLAMTDGGWREHTAPEQPLADRLSRFNEVLKLSAQGVVELPKPTYLPVTLDSDVILKDSSFRHLGRLDGEWLFRAAGISNAELVSHTAGLHRVTGWNALWGLPRSDDWAISMGSVFLLGLPDELTSQHISRLEQVEQEGIGLRRAEGFGRIRFADPFHVEVNGI